MFNLSEINQSKLPMPRALALSLFGILALNSPAYSQGSTPAVSFGNSLYGAGGTSTLKTPLVPTASFSLPGIMSSQGAPPPLGQGLVPLPPNPGMLLTPPSLIPWASGTAGNSFSLPNSQVITPSNQIDLPNNKISLPGSNASAMPPGAMNAQVRGSIPYGPSTPGADPGMLRPPSFNNGSSTASSGQSQQSAAAIGSVGSNGQINGSAPIIRPVRQSSNDFGLKRSYSGYRAEISGNTFQGWVPRPSSSTTDFGQGAKVGAKPAQISFDAPRALRASPSQSGAPAQNSAGTHVKNFVGAQVTNDLFGIPMVNPYKMSTSSSGIVSRDGQTPLTTIIPPTQ